MGGRRDKCTERKAQVDEVVARNPRRTQTMFYGEKTTTKRFSRRPVMSSYVRLFIPLNGLARREFAMRHFFSSSRRQSSEWKWVEQWRSASRGSPSMLEHHTYIRLDFVSLFSMTRSGWFMWHGEACLYIIKRALFFFFVRVTHR